MPKEVTPRPARTRRIPPPKTASNSSSLFTVRSDIGQHRCTAKATAAQLCARLIRLPQWMGQDLGPDRHPGSDRKQLLSIAARQVRNRADGALSPEQLVREGGDVAHVDAGADDRRSLRGGPQRRRD